MTKIFNKKTLGTFSIVIGLVFSFISGAFITTDFFVSKTETRDLIAYYELMDDLAEYHKKHYEVMEGEDCCLQVDYSKVINTATTLTYEYKND